MKKCNRTRKKELETLLLIQHYAERIIKAVKNKALNAHQNE